MTASALIIAGYSAVTRLWPQQIWSTPSTWGSVVYATADGISEICDSLNRDLGWDVNKNYGETWNLVGQCECPEAFASRWYWRLEDHRSDGKMFQVARSVRVGRDGSVIAAGQVKVGDKCDERQALRDCIAAATATDHSV